jgi:hypothetical protein
MKAVIKRYSRRFVPRYWSNDELSYVGSYLPAGAKIVNVSGWRDEDKEGRFYRDYFRAPLAYHVSNYDGDRARGTNVHSDIGIDLTKPLDEKLAEAYDIALNHTVLEHVPDPSFAFGQIAKLTADLLLTIVPFKQKLHFEAGMYGDYYRFTPFSMRELHKRNGLVVLYESYTPRPSLDVYLFYVATKFPDRHADFPRRVSDLQTLNQQLGNFSARDLAANAFARWATKYLL